MLVAAIQEDSSSDLDFYQRCGLKVPPILVRMRVLDQALRAGVGGIGDITAPVEDLAGLNLPVSHVYCREPSNGIGNVRHAGRCRRSCVLAITSTCWPVSLACPREVHLLGVI